MSKVQVKITNTEKNPFYGLRNVLSLYQNGAKGISHAMLDAAFNEVKGNKQFRQLFWSILFSIGDITARQHNIFKRNKIDNGGNAERSTFRDIMNWMRTYHKAQFLKFMWARLFNEFTSFDNLIATRVRTTKKTKNVLQVINQVGTNTEYTEELAKYLAHIIKTGSNFDKWLVAKFLTRPRLSKRKGHKQMLPATKTNMLIRQALLKAVSDQAGFAYEERNNYINFTGYYEWRKALNKNMESVLFSSGEIRKLDQQQFLEWLDSLPASARFRVRSRLLTKENTPKPKWGDLYTWFLIWENYKKEKQSEQRVLEEKVRQGSATVDDKVKLEEVKKEAKVTTGAINFKDIFVEIINGTVDEVKLQPFLDKIKLDYNTLVFVDDSGSMNSVYQKNAFGFTAFDFATFMATICLLKNPDETGRSLLGFYSSHARLFANITAVKQNANRLLKGVEKTVNLPLIDPRLTFLENLHNIRGLAYAVQTSNGTNISAIPDDLNRWAAGDSLKIEQLQNFPVWTIISDGCWNSTYSPEASINDFMRKCDLYFGFKPFIVAIDVAGNASADITRFQGIENFMFVRPNPTEIEQFLTNFRDMDVMDVYAPLEMFFRSNRYALIRENTL